MMDRKPGHLSWDVQHGLDHVACRHCTFVPFDGQVIVLLRSMEAWK